MSKCFTEPNHIQSQLYAHELTSQLTPWIRALLKRMTVVQLLMNFAAF